MNPIVKALDEVSRRIPREILEKVFIDRHQNWRDVRGNVKDQILLEVVKPRVLIDCDLVGGVEVLIPLDDLPFEPAGNSFTVVYRIPKRMTGGRSITSVLNVTYGNSVVGMSYGTNAMSQSSPAMQLGASVMDAQLRMPYIGSAQCQLIGENVVMIRDSVTLPGNLFIRCILGNDENLSHIQVRSFRAFSRLVELAVKSHIYNNYVIDLDMGELRSGSQLGRIKEIIDGYADAETMYQEYLTETWQKVAFMNDRETMARFTKLLIGGSR